MNKNLILGILIGVCLTVTAFHVWFLYSIRNAVSVQGQQIAQVIGFLNQSIEQSRQTTNQK